MTLETDLTAAITKIQADSLKLNMIINGDKFTSVQTDGGLVKTAAKAIFELGSVASRILTDFSNAPDDSLSKLGFSGFSKNTNAHFITSLTTLSLITTNSIFGFENKPDAPFQGKGIVHTLVFDSSFAVQIVYRITDTGTIDVNQTPHYHRRKLSGVWSVWGSATEYSATLQLAVRLASRMAVKGDILYYDGSLSQKLSIGSEKQLLTVVSGQPEWVKSPHRVGSRVDDIPSTDTETGGDQFAGVIMSDGSLRNWGNLGNGRLGVGTVSLVKTNVGAWVQPVFPKTTAKVTKWVISGANNLAVFDDGSVWGWGNNDYGCLGLGHTNNVTVPTKIPNLTNIKEAYLSINYSMFRDNGGIIKSCGYNEFGQLGQGSTLNVVTPGTISGHAFYSVYIEGGINGKGFGLTSNGQLYSWGKNDHGCLGLGVTTSVVLTPTLVTNLSGEIVTMFDTTVQDTYCSCIVLCASGKVYTWGYNAHSQLGVGDLTLRSSPTYVTSLGTDNKLIACCGGQYGTAYVVKNNNQIYSTGYSLYGQAGVVSYTKSAFTRMSYIVDNSALGVSQIQVVGVGTKSGVAVLYDNGVIEVAGYNANGALGAGDSVSINSLTELIGLMKTAPKKLGVVGSGLAPSSQAALSIVTVEGYYYQCGPTVNNQQLWGTALCYPQLVNI